MLVIAKVNGTALTAKYILLERRAPWRVCFREPPSLSNLVPIAAIEILPIYQDPMKFLYHRIHPNTYIYFPATLGGYLETRFRHRAAPRRAVVPCATVNKENTLVRLQHRGAIREYKGE